MKGKKHVYVADIPFAMMALAWNPILKTASAKGVFWTICAHADADGVSFPGIDLIAKETGISRSSVFEAIDYLLAKGAIVKLVQKGGTRPDGSGIPNTYCVQRPPDAVAAATPPIEPASADELAELERRAYEYALAGVRFEFSVDDSDGRPRLHFKGRWLREPGAEDLSRDLHVVFTPFIRAIAWTKFVERIKAGERRAGKSP